MLVFVLIFLSISLLAWVAIMFHSTNLSDPNLFILSVVILILNILSIVFLGLRMK